MELSELGADGPPVSLLGIGCNNFGRRIDFERSRAVVEEALALGVTFFDTADVYGDGESERYLGRVLAGRWDDVVVATKFGMAMGDDDGLPRGSERYVRRAVEASLDRLGADYVDLLYYHRHDGVTPLAETMGVMADLVQEGKAHYVGCSNLDAQQLAEAAAAGLEHGARVVALQNEYNLLERGAERDVLPLALELGVGFVPYFPLASGLLTGKYRRGEPPPEGTRLAARPEALTDDAFDEVERLERFAAERGRTLLDLAIAAVASQPAVASVVAGATTPEQVRANVRAAEWRLTPEELAAL
jgi:aryl-alcohol dehydrogenase-like predicted oxidoreductase